MHGREREGSVMTGSMQLVKVQPVSAMRKRNKTELLCDREEKRSIEIEIASVSRDSKCRQGRR